MSLTPQTGRSNQRRRTRKDLLEAAGRLMKDGRKPSLEEIAEEALVSRATAYRYFTGLEELLVEAALDMALPEPDALFPPDAPSDPARRLEMLDRAMDAMMAENEGLLRLMLANALERSAGSGAAPRRQNRRTPLIEAALDPAGASLDPATRELLTPALAVLLGTESMIVFSDVLQMDAAGAAKVKRWAVEALLAAARRRES